MPQSKTELNKQLLDAAAHGNLSKVKKCVADGADINATNESGESALTQAAQAGYASIIYWLIEQGADANTKTTNGWTPLHYTAIYGHKIAALILLEAGADPEARDTDGYTPLLSAVEKNQLEMIKLFYQSRVDREATDYNGNTALLVAMLNDHIDLAFSLIESGANVNAKNKNEETPLLLAFRYANIELIHLIIVKSPPSARLFIFNHLITLITKHKDWLSLKTLIDFIAYHEKFINPHASFISAQTKRHIEKILSTFKQTCFSTPLLAISYNDYRGGDNAQRLINDIDFATIDYHRITPHKDEIDIIRFSQPGRAYIFSEAKRKARLFLYDKDFLLIPGNGNDINPWFFEATPSYASSYDNRDVTRTVAEMALIHVAMQMGLPVLGICGGNQLLNVYFGGSIRDLKNKEHDDNNEIIHVFPNSKLAGTLTAPALPQNPIEMNFRCMHHQTIDKLGGTGIIDHQEDFLTIAARSKNTDGNIEAIESNYGAPVFGLQFHLEETPRRGDIETDKERNKNILNKITQSANTCAHKKMLHTQIKSYSNQLQKNETTFEGDGKNQSAQQQPALVRGHAGTWISFFNELPTMPEENNNARGKKRRLDEINESSDDTPDAKRRVWCTIA